MFKNVVGSKQKEKKGRRTGPIVLETHSCPLFWSARSPP